MRLSCRSPRSKSSMSSTEAGLVNPENVSAASSSSASSAPARCRPDLAGPLLGLKAVNWLDAQAALSLGSGGPTESARRSWLQDPGGCGVSSTTAAWTGKPRHATTCRSRGPTVSPTSPGTPRAEIDVWHHRLTRPDRLERAQNHCFGAMLVAFAIAAGNGGGVVWVMVMTAGQVAHGTRDGGPEDGMISRPVACPAGPPRFAGPHRARVRSPPLRWCSGSPLVRAG